MSPLSTASRKARRRRIPGGSAAALLLLLLVTGPPARGAAANGAGISLGTEDVRLPEGYTIEPVLTGLTYPTSLEFAPDGSLYVAESGHSYGQFWADARVLKLRPDGRVFGVAGGFRGPIMDLTLRDDRLYVAHRGMISVVDLGTVERSRRVRDLIAGLPALPNGQHFNGSVAFGPDGKIYFAVGTVTNSGVPGIDDLLFGWLPDFPWMRDAPAREITLTGENYPSPDVLGPELLRPVRGGAFLPFGTPSRAGQRIPAHPVPSGAVFRANADGSDLEVYAWGIRSPFGFGFGPDGRLYMVNHGMDDKGARAAENVPDTLLVIREGAWYGWPDYPAGIPITDERFKPRVSRHPGFVMRDHPPVEPPLVRFEPHAADTKFDWSSSERFGFQGEMFMAEFGDGSPLNTGLRPIPRRGFRVVRVNPSAGSYEPFMTIENPGLESTRGPKRPIDVKFDPTGDSLYLLDFGLLTVRLSGRQVGVQAQPQTGTIWRIRRATAEPGSTPPASPTPSVADPSSSVGGARLLSWWTVRSYVLGIRQDMETALAHSARSRESGGPTASAAHREQAEWFVNSARTRAVLALKRIDAPDVTDNGTRLLLQRVIDWADAPTRAPTRLYDDDPTIRAVREWIGRTDFPETEQLRRAYALPGRWQRPIERDIRP